MIKAMLYARKDERTQYVQCHMCCRQCVIAAGRHGFCGVRVNHHGDLYSRIAESVSAACMDPIEKKPLYHFYPGTQVFSLGAIGCSFACPGCQNGHLSHQAYALQSQTQLTILTPKEAVAAAIRHHASGICWTYNDPAIWLEYTLPGAQAAKAAGLYTAYVTNGTATREHLDAIGPYLDAYRVDIKAYSREAYRQIAGFSHVAAIRDSVRYAYERWGMHIECVTNVTPTINDSVEELTGIATWIAETLGKETPWHVTRFYPHDALKHLPTTPMKTLQVAEDIGRQAGLHHIYMGNVPGNPQQHSMCPSCGTRVIIRQGAGVTNHLMPGGGCPQCGTRMAGRFAL